MTGSAENSTIAYYDEHAEAFAAGTAGADMSLNRMLFLAYVRNGGRVLDAGCGSGRDTLAFREAGYEADAFDGSEAMCRLASERLGTPVACRRFEELEGEEEYDGIWACASLLHVKAADLPDVMGRLRKLLKPGGAIYISFKEGSGERMKDGRCFHDMTAEECRDTLEAAGFRTEAVFRTSDVRPGRGKETWINGIGTKPLPSAGDSP